MPTGIASHARVATLRAEPEREHENDHRHRREGDELRRDDGQRDELSREADLADERRVLDEAARRGLQRRGEEHPRRQPTEQEEPVVVEVGRLGLPEHGEDDQVDEHEREWQRQRPREPEERALVLRPQVATEEAAEQLAVAEEIPVDLHGGDCRATPGGARLVGAAKPPTTPMGTTLTGRERSRHGRRAARRIPRALGLLRSPSVGGRLVAVPTGERWHDRVDADVRRRRDRGRARGRRRAGRPHRSRRAVVGARSASSPERRSSSSRAVVDDVRHLSPLTKLAASSPPPGSRSRPACASSSSTNDVLGIASRSSGSSGSRTRSTCSTTWTASRRRWPRSHASTSRSTRRRCTRTTSSSSSRSRSAFACLGFLPFNLRPGGGAHVFMGDGGSQLLGFLLAALGLASSWTTAGTTVATMLLPLLVLAIPILDTTLVTVGASLERRPVTQGGPTTPRTGSSTTGCPRRRRSRCSR